MLLQFRLVYATFFISAFYCTVYKVVNDKYNKNISVGSVVIVMCIGVFAIAYHFIQKMNTNDITFIIKNVAINSIVTNISFDSHKPTFKQMTLADG
ncbi:hypothetical protein ACFOWM_07480 [Ferruginibacter yonginensis]|uniref:Uncharacterized protein n=1 Tax=Ferruginibacter yonginensis TaxID=1310416 RepID=A0ABV8QSS3_9BACT